MARVNKKKKKKTLVPFRLNVLFFLVFVLFSVLILRLGVVQIVYGDEYRREVERTEEVTVNNSVPRGKMYDRNFNLMVDNQPLDAITYTRKQGTKSSEMLDTARTLATLIEKETDKVTERDKKDFWILLHPELADKKVTKKEKQQVEEGLLEPKDLYQLQIDRITKEEYDSLSEDELEVLAIFREFSSGYALTPQIVKNKNVTKEEFARVSENLDSLPGVNISTDWDRSYTYDDTLKSVLGKVSTSEEGLPSENLDYYLARDYSRNDRVGKSYIEMQYEDVLQGQKAKIRNITDKAGNIVNSEVISPGQRGQDLVLTIDMDLQLATEKIIEDQLLAKKRMGSTPFLDRAFVVLLDPKTGEILTMAGKQYARNSETGKYEMNDFALGNITTSYTMGSSVKGATILTGYQEGAIQPGTVFFDTAIRIKDTPKKGSWKDMGSINDLTALKQSSNVYMFRTAINIAGGNYVPNAPLSISSDAFPTIRNSFAQFGLGVRTGIDLPNEMVGFKGNEGSPGKLLDLVIGQYDTYTPMQLAQYVATIASGGNRMQPHIVKEIREPVDDNEALGPVAEENTPTVLNRLNMKDEWIDRVQTGFEKVAMEPGGTAYSTFASKPYTVAAKTGTAEAFYDGPNRKNYSEPQPTMNITIVGYAPAENPEVAFSVVVPWAYQRGSGHTMNREIGAAVLDAYFDLKNERAKETKIENTTTVKVNQHKDAQDNENEEEENE